MKFFYILTFTLIIVCSTSTSAEFMNRVTWEKLAILYSHISPEFNYDDHYQEYVKAFHPKKWSIYKNDEFLLEENKNKVIQEMKSKSNDFNTKQNFYIYTSLYIGKYDFQNSAFPLQEGLKKNTYYTFKPANTPSYSMENYPGRFRIFFGNPEFLTGIKMSKNDAKKFITSRKNQWGTVDRKINVYIKFVISGFKDNQPGKELLAEIKEYKYDL